MTFCKISIRAACSIREKMIKNSNKKAISLIVALSCAAQLFAADVVNVVSSDKVEQGSKNIGKTIVVDVKKQDWQTRRLEYINALKRYSKDQNDKEAWNTIDKSLSNYEKQPWSITPMEAMDLFQTFYMPKEGIKAMNMLVAEAILGYRDVLQWASKSGRSEIFWNEQFLTRALTNGGKTNKTMSEWLALVKDKPEEAKKIVADGVKFAKTINSFNGSSYDRKWPTAYGLERMINAMDGKQDTLKETPNMPDDKAMDEAVTKISAYYLPKSLEKK